LYQVKAGDDNRAVDLRFQTCLPRIGSIPDGLGRAQQRSHHIESRGVIMKASRPVAISVAVLGLALIVAGPLIPGGERLVRNAPPDSGHITDLERALDGSILAGTEAGELWRYTSDQWQQVPVDLGGQPVTSLSADLGDNAAKGPIGTGGGLVNVPAGMPPLPVRVRDEIMAENRLLVGTGKGLYVQGDGQWLHIMDEISVYALFIQRLGNEAWLHLGSVGAGVLSAKVSDPLSWEANREGLPEGANVFSFALTESGLLIVGTDKGLYWQEAPQETWQPLKVGLENSRILSMLFEAADTDGIERLWIGSDDGLWRAQINASGAAPEALAYAELIQAPPDHVRYGVSWIVPFGDGVMLSAGSVYQFGPMGLKGWYWISLGGLILLLLGGWLMPGRSETSGASA
jgi:hypothetical protein